MELLIFCVSSDGHSEDVLCNVRGGMIIPHVKLPILLHKLPGLVTQTPHDMISDRFLPQMVLLHAQMERKVICSYHRHRAANFSGRLRS